MISIGSRELLSFLLFSYNRKALLNISQANDAAVGLLVAIVVGMSIRMLSLSVALLNVEVVAWMGRGTYTV